MSSKLETVYMSAISGLMSKGLFYTGENQCKTPRIKRKLANRKKNKLANKTKRENRKGQKMDSFTTIMLLAMTNENNNKAADLYKELKKEDNGKLYKLSINFEEVL